MVGLIQKLLLDMINEMAGPETLAKVKKEAGLDHEDYKINTVYSDEESRRLFAATLKVLNISLEQAYTVYADYFGKDSVKRFPTWFQMSKNSYDFLLIQPTIHNCFATAVADQDSRKKIIDKFRVEKLSKKVITHYNSPNQHCGLYIKLAEWIINYYKDEAIITEKKCLKKGDSECEIHVEWTKFANEQG